MTPFFYWLVTYFTKFVLLPLYARITVVGLENVPPDGPLIIASNHLNDADPGVISTRFRRRVVYMAKVELFEVPVLAQFMRTFGAFPVKRNEADLAALRLAKQTLDAGLALCIFPEGRRSGEAAQLAEAWPGAALLALRNEAPILPVAITGSQRLSLPLMFLHFYRQDKVTMTIGKPFVLPRPERINAESAKQGTRVIMERIAELLPPEYKGYYGSSDSAPE